MNEASNGPLDPVSLKRYCDWKDSAACFLKNGANLPNLERFPIIQGSAPSGRAIFSSVLPAAFAGQWFLHDPSAKTLTKVAVSSSITRPPSQWRIDQIALSGLSTGKRYHLLLADAQGKLRDLRSFHTVPAADPASPLRVAFISGNHKPELWASLANREPQLLIAMGNMVHPGPNAPSVWERYANSATATPFFYSPALIPTITTWNDRDFGNEGGNPADPRSDQIRETFEAFYPSMADAKTLRHGPGVAKALRAGGLTFVLLDNRSFRTTNARPPACARSSRPQCQESEWLAKASNDESHFGRVQEDWAFEQVSNSPGPVWLISGDPWFGEYRSSESFAGNHPLDFRKFLAQLKGAAKRNKSAPALLFASGGVARSELQKVTPYEKYGTFEITAAADSEGDIPAEREARNPRLVAEAAASASFVIVSAEAPSGRVHAELTAVGPSEGTLFSRKIEVEPPKDKPRRRSR